MLSGASVTDFIMKRELLCYPYRNGKESISTKVAVTAGEWIVKEELWNWTYDFNPINDLIGYAPDETNKEEIVDGEIVIDVGNSQPQLCL